MLYTFVSFAKETKKEQNLVTYVNLPFYMVPHSLPWAYSWLLRSGVTFDLGVGGPMQCGNVTLVSRAQGKCPLHVASALTSSWMSALHTSQWNNGDFIWYLGYNLLYLHYKPNLYLDAYHIIHIAICINKKILLQFFLSWIQTFLSYLLFVVPWVVH